MLDHTYSLCHICMGNTLSRRNWIKSWDRYHDLLNEDSTSNDLIIPEDNVLTLSFSVRQDTLEDSALRSCWFCKLIWQLLARTDTEEAVMNWGVSQDQRFFDDVVRLRKPRYDVELRFHSSRSDARFFNLVSVVERLSSGRTYPTGGHLSMRSSEGRYLALMLSASDKLQTLFLTSS